MKFAETLKKLRKGKEFSQKKLAKAIALNHTYLSKIENNCRQPPSRDKVILMAKALQLNPVETDNLLLSSEYAPLTPPNDSDTFSQIKKINKDRWIEAKKEMADFLDYIRLKYVGKNPYPDNALLAQYIYSQIKQKGIKVLYEAASKSLAGAVVIYHKKILLSPIGKSPLKGIWGIPNGFLNLKKGDKTPRDTAVRLLKECFINDVRVKIVRELTEVGGPLEDLDTQDYFARLGLIPPIFKIFEIRLEGLFKLNNSQAMFVNVEEVDNLDLPIHALLYQILASYLNDPRKIKKIYEKGEETLRLIISKRSFKFDMGEFSKKRINRI
ncbi:hypothetical protein COU86_00015 [Candidatus Roizmanbacteria bacterium CG10_big_fil_rev_8_21_14_0_10_36_26]|uniref:HTH cro/C1-type domain-containing protein n=1 Tax=Candidatus Roizmanbacteria bacterium CG10_big_fil_rev_8_21_14_0_10_36_26 TaxID=1974851 RepID=A0A2M8KMW8_9BACT|nr:MAG: hypothetical protein COU86_00015 [Candidatus Roizmanbacteria bacterium CG10_big_fil_rev_8_21_14_0_10_36_26]